MHKNKLKNDIKTLKIGFKEIYKLQPWLLTVTILDALFKSAAPFINIYMSARIIDELLGAKAIDRLIFLAGITIGLNLIIHLISTGLNHLSVMLRSIMSQNLDMRLNEKIISMDYEHVENPEVHSLRTKIAEAENINGGGIYALTKYIGDLTKGFVTVITSIALVIDLFKANVASNGYLSFMNSKLFTYGFLVFILMGTIFNLNLKTKADKKGFGYFSKFMDVNRIFGFYMEQVLDYNVGKGIRLYNQREIFNKEVESYSRETKKMFNDIGNMNGKFSGIEAFISSLLGGMVYIFVGLRAISGAITIGSIVQYAGSINQFISGNREVLSAVNSIRNNNQYLVSCKIN